MPKVDIKIRSIKEVPCIALYLCCNATGSWNFYNLVSRKRIRRMIWKKMVMTGLFVEKNERSSWQGDSGRCRTPWYTCRRNANLKPKRELRRRRASWGPSRNPGSRNAREWAYQRSRKSGWCPGVRASGWWWLRQWGRRWWYCQWCRGQQGR